MGVTPDLYRRALRRFASGVTIVTVEAPDGPHGMTASSFASVSLDPPLILVCLDKGSRTRALIREAGSFGVSVLASSQSAESKDFASATQRRFEGISLGTGATGAPLIDGAIAHLECSIHEWVQAGDHDIVVGEVIACESFDGQPLVYFEGGYGTFTGL